MEKTLNQFRPSDKGIVLRLTVEGKMKRRLLDMGITPGAEIIMRKTAPLGDPMQVTVRNYELTLRKEEAANIVMEVSQ